MTLVWLTRQVVPFALPPAYYRLRSVETDGRCFDVLGVAAVPLQHDNRARLRPALQKPGERERL